jgi:glycerol-3-phosphate dehydrogenase
MRRDLSALGSETFDLVIVGGGIYGATIAWDATLRGLSVALVEKGDFGAGTSFNNFKTIHGGLRYIQHADFRRMRESIRERRTLLKIAPHLVHPLAFLVPTYKTLKQSRFAMKLALLANDIASFDRNRLSDPEKFLPGGRLISRSECLEWAPGVKTDGLTGGAVWYDAHMHNSDRVNLSFLLSAAKAGAQVANHLEAVDFMKDGNRVRGIKARDRLGNETFHIRGRVVLNAAGPWVDRVLSLLGGEDRPPNFHFSKALNLVTRHVIDDVAVGVACKHVHRDRDAVIGKGSRFLFLVPWRGHCLIGTNHTHYKGVPDELEATEEEVQQLLDDINEGYPAAGLRREDVRLVHRGILPMVPPRAGDMDGVTLEKQFQIIDHRKEGLGGLLTVVGVKYTTARDVAEKAVDRVFDSLEKKPPRSRSAETPLYGGNIERFSTYLEDVLAESPSGLDAEVCRHLVKTYGSSYREILGYIKESPKNSQTVTGDSPVLRAEIIHAVREEQALDLASVVLRRTELGSAGHPGRACLETVAEIMAGELGWDRSKIDVELGTTEEIYRRRS